MESNTDNNLADKLRGFEAPYEPEAWKEMEALLDKKKKRRVFFWWWTGGIAAALLLGGLLWGVMKPEMHNGQEPKEQTTQRTLKSSEETEFGGPEKQEVGETGEKSNGGLQENEVIAQAENNIKPKQANYGTNEVRKASRQPIIEVENGQTSQSKALRSTGNKNKNAHRGERNGSVQVAKQKEKAKELVSGSEVEGESAVAQVANTSAEVKEEQLSLQKAAEQEAATAIPAVTDSSAEEPIANAIENKETENGKTKKEGAKGGKKIFSFHLGARVDLLGVTTGPSGKVPDSLKTREPWKFSYAVGPTVEFMLWKRLSFFTGVQYSMNAFKVKNPTIAQNELQDPNDTTGGFYSYLCRSYTSTSHELIFPVGIKAYPLSTDKFRLFVSAGIINHVKLKETFELEIEKVPNTSSLFTPAEDHYLHTSQNPFVNNSQYDMVGTSSALGDQAGKANWLSVSGTSRYYASFYASVGAEFVFKKKYQLVVEPLYRMSINTIGEQHKRLHSAGLSLGFKYQFGK